MAIRWRRWLLGLGVALVLTLVVLWLALPSLIVAIARRSLPHRLHDTLAITQVATAPARLVAAPQARAVIAISPGRIQELAARFGHSVPGLLLRQGLCAQAAWHDEKLVPELPLEAVVVVRGDADPPQLSVAVPAEPLAQLIARTAEPVLMAGFSLRWTYRLDPGSVLAHDGPPTATEQGWRRRFRAEVSGQVTAQLNGGVCILRVTRAVIQADMDFDRREDGWHLHGTADVLSIESQIEQCTSPLLRSMAGNIELTLENILNTTVLSEFARRKDILPLDVPIDMGVQAIVSATPADCPAAVATLLPP